MAQTGWRVTLSIAATASLDRVLRLTLVASVAMLAACASSDFMRPLPRPPRLTVSANRATVVFLRPRSTAPNTMVTIVDEDGRFLGDSLPSTCFSAQVEPGEQLFVGIAANTAALAATLEAGRVYYVEVMIRLGSVSSRAHLFAVHPGEERDRRLMRWWRDCDHHTVDTQAGQRALALREAERVESVRRAREQVARFSAEERAQRTLSPSDGRVP